MVHQASKSITSTGANKLKMRRPLLTCLCLLMTATGIRAQQGPSGFENRRILNAIRLGPGDELTLDER